MSSAVLDKGLEQLGAVRSYMQVFSCLGVGTPNPKSRLYTFDGDSFQAESAPARSRLYTVDKLLPLSWLLD